MLRNRQPSKNNTIHKLPVNWGLWRHIPKALGEPILVLTTFTQDYTYTLDGTGVDLVIPR